METAPVVLADGFTDAVVTGLGGLLRSGLVVVVGVGIVALIVVAASRVSGRVSQPLALLVFLGPALVLLFVGLIYPALRTTYLSFFNSDSTEWRGLANYAWVFTDPDQRQVLINTAIWIIVAPLAATGIGLLLALLIDRMKRESVAKSLIFMPMAISFVGASIIWGLVYQYRTSCLVDLAAGAVCPEDQLNPQVGLLPQILMWLGMDDPPNLLLVDTLRLNTFLLIVVMIWIQVGFAMVVLSAAIKGIPADVIEAASIDGASGFKLFRQVTIPMIRGTLIVVLTTIAIATLKVFDIVRTLGAGGRANTDVLANSMYDKAFTQDQAGRGAALAVVLFLAVTPLIIYNIRQLREERATR